MKIFLKDRFSPGDTLMMTAAVRDLKAARPMLAINLSTPSDELFLHNPLLDRNVTEQNADRVIQLDCPLINYSNELPFHYIHAYRMELEQQLGFQIPQGTFCGDLYLSKEERQPMPGLPERYWLVNAGYKEDCPLKFWGYDNFQKVVDSLHGKVQFVQIGSSKHYHRKLTGAIDFIGKTNIRQLIQLVYRAEGVLTGISFLMHLASAVPTPDRRLRPTVVLAGGREPASWEAYPGHQYMHVIGALSCCQRGGCWRSQLNSCAKPTACGNDTIGSCMAMIRPEQVAQMIELYHGE